MKKLIALFLILAMSFALVACSGDNGSNDGGNTPDDGGNTPDDGGNTPDDGGNTPDDGGNTPDDGGNTPDDGGNTPDDGGNDDGNKIDFKALLSELLSSYKIDPFENIPATMLPGYGTSLIENGDVVEDYSTFISIPDITYGGHGEQWNMIVGNLRQSMLFFGALDVVDSISTSSIAIFEAFIDENPADTAHHSFMNGIYSVTIDCDAQRIYYVVDYTADLPVLGTQTVQLALAMNILDGSKCVRVQIGDANALTYYITESGYEFAIKYLGVRRAYFSIYNDKNGNTAGHIYEFITVSDAEIASAADFYITDGYVTAVGNKADGLPLFNNYICELYDSITGRMIGYEVMETKSAVTFNTLWFDLSDIDGINSIRYVEKTDDTEAAIYLNGSSTALETVEYGGINLKTKSRRFDIEFRTQYYYYYDSENGEYVEVKASVPMLFIQEEKLDDLESDFKKANGLDVAVTTDAIDLALLMERYDIVVDVFKENKEIVTPELIAEMIGERIIFED